MKSEGVYLRAFLEPLAAWLDDSSVSDILINKPGEVWCVRAGGGMNRADAPDVTDSMLSRLAQQIAAFSNQGVSREHPLLAATLPGGARVQVVAPPATRKDAAFAIRKHIVADLTLEHMAQTGAFAGAGRAAITEKSNIDQRLHRLLDAGDMTNFFRQAVRNGKNILISGGTGSGKTTFLNALLKEVPQHERIILIEDTPEINLWHPNAVGLVAVKGELGESQVGVGELLHASLRMRPDRLLVGEIRGAEAFTFLRAVNTGHPGSITTIHADSPRGALDQISFMTLEAGLALTRQEIIDYVAGVIDVIVQLNRADGRCAVSDVVFNRAS